MMADFLKTPTGLRARNKGKLERGFKSQFLHRECLYTQIHKCD